MHLAGPQSLSSPKHIQPMEELNKNNDLVIFQIIIIVNDFTESNVYFARIHERVIKQILVLQKSCCRNGRYTLCLLILLSPCNLCNSLLQSRWGWISGDLYAEWAYPTSGLTNIGVAGGPHTMQAIQCTIHSPGPSSSCSRGSCGYRSLWAYRHQLDSAAQLKVLGWDFRGIGILPMSPHSFNLQEIAIKSASFYISLGPGPVTWYNSLNINSPCLEVWNLHFNDLCSHYPTFPFLLLLSAQRCRFLHQIPPRAGQKKLYKIAVRMVNAHHKFKFAQKYMDGSSDPQKAKGKFVLLCQILSHITLAYIVMGPSLAVPILIQAKKLLQRIYTSWLQILTKFWF